MSYPDHYHVDSGEEAMALAERLRIADEYNIFRGQVVDWPMRSSFSRRGAAEQTEALGRLEEFVGFVRKTPEIAHLDEDPNSVLAVAQHYGIPTRLVDFSTSPEVAGWFASHGDAMEGRPSVIYLAHEEYIQEKYHDCLPDLYTLRIDVANLWRLQAQKGMFVNLPFEDVPELDSWLNEAFGTIRFPYRGAISDIPESAIYPERKSRLEFLFDAFITEEKQRAAVANLDALGLRRIRIPDAAGPRPASAFRTGTVPERHASWEESRIALWLRPPVEEFRRQDHPPELALVFPTQVPAAAELPGVVNRQSDVVLEFLSAANHAREGFLTLHVAIEGAAHSLDACEHPDSRLRRTVVQDLADCWDAMRRFPYSDEVLADALANLATAWAMVHGYRQNQYAVLEALLGESLLLDVGLVEGGQRAYIPVPTKEVSEALRDDLPELLEPEFLEFIDKPDRLLHQVNEPERLFDFDKLVPLFGRRFMPGQFLLRQREVIFASPTRIQRLGNR